MKTAFAVVCSLVSYAAADQLGGAHMKGLGLNLEAAVTEDRIQGSTGDIAAVISSDMKENLDVKYGRPGKIAYEPILMGEDKSSLPPFNPDDFDPEMLKELNITMDELRNATSVEDAADNTGLSMDNVDWCLDFYPDWYREDNCAEKWDDFVQQVEDFDKMVGNMTGNDTSIDYAELRENEIKIDNQVNIKVNDDFHFKVAVSDDMKFTEMRLKFLDYFDWALIQGQSKYTNMMDTCANECGLQDKRDMCCTTVKMFQKGQKDSLTQIQCMNRNVPEMSTGIWIEDFYYEYECQEGRWENGKKFSSGSSSLVLGAAATILATLSFM